MWPSPAQFELFRVAAPALAVALLIEIIISLTKPQRSNPATPTFVAFAAATIGCLLLNTLEISTTSEESCLLWARMVYLFIVLPPVIWLSFAIHLTTGKRGLPWWALATLLVVPLATLVIVFSDRLMTLMWDTIRFEQVGGYVVCIRGNGAWSRLHTVYNYGISLASVIVLLWSFALRLRYYRQRTVWVVLAVAAPVVTSLLYVTKLIPGMVLDFTPLGYALGATVFFIVLYRLDLFAIVPVARDLLIERMREGILVVDMDGRLIDLNPAALSILGVDEGLIGKALGRVGDSSSLPPSLVVAATKGVAGSFSLPGASGARHYAVDPLPLEGRAGLRGRLVVIRDETEIRDLLKRVETMARIDELTGLSNRRAFMESAAVAVSHATRHGRPLCAVMFDLDDFKAINDKQGHSAGDAALRSFARVLSTELRESDVVGRIGGDEFAAILPSTDSEGAVRVCERIRERFADESPVSAGGGARPRASVSIGVVQQDAGHRSVDSLLAAADAALYQAKSAGGNRVQEAHQNV